MAQLDGWKAIAQHINRTEDTARIWVDQYGMPAFKINGRIVSDTEAIDEWRQKMALMRVGLSEEVADALVSVAAKEVKARSRKAKKGKKKAA